MNENKTENGAQNPENEKLLDLGVPKEKLKSLPKRKRSAAAIGMEAFGKEKQEQKPAEAPAGPETESAESEDAQSFDEYVAALLSEAGEFAETEPAFDMESAFQNPRFVYLTSPAVGLSVSEAFYAIYGGALRERELLYESAAMEYAAKETAKRISAARQTLCARPSEGSTSQGASLSAFDYAHASREQREALKNRIRLAAACGEKVFPER